MALESSPFSHGEFAMDGFSSSIWSHHHDFFPQNTEDLKQRLLHAKLELETLKSTASEEMRKKDETIHKLINLVKVTAKERDEANEQVKTLLSYLQSQNPQQTGCVNSGLTESDSLSDTQIRTNNTHSFVSSPVESFYHADSPNITNTTSAVEYNNVSIIIDELAKKKPLPEKGKLMHAVVTAGPLLQNLMLAGPLPTWRHPPPGFQVPSFSMKETCGVSPLNFGNKLGFCAKRPRYE